MAKTPHGHWHTSTVISAVGLRGPFAPAVFDGPTTSAVFRAYVEQVLVPELRPRDIVIMDNLAPHKSAGVREAIEAGGGLVLYLPPYSPDYNPIEPMWSKLKQYFRTVMPRQFEAVCEAMAGGLTTVTRNDCLGYFNHCGYAT